MVMQIYIICIPCEGIFLSMCHDFVEKYTHILSTKVYDIDSDRGRIKFREG
jgi:hypothetical protein